MNPVTLVVQGKDEPVAQACGKCGMYLPDFSRVVLVPTSAPEEA